MPPKCSICIHPDRAEIDRALVAGEPFRNIAKRSGTSATALHRHKSEHLPKQLVKAAEAAEVADADDLLAQIKDLRNKAVSILQKAEEAGDYRTALMGIREARACVETLLEVEGELDRRGTVNMIISPQWVQVRATMLDALMAYPEARQAVAAALISAEEGEHRAIA